MSSASLTEQDIPGVFCADRLITVFNGCFNDTRLVSGAEEPLYQPAASGLDYHQLYFRQDYFASALHEISHWCIAGSERRQQVDFGYWYAPEGRSQVQQGEFEAVECKPQALEWFFSKACNYRFEVSIDNLDLTDGMLPESIAFKQRVLEQALHWRETRLPQRAGYFFGALAKEFATDVVFSELQFTLTELP